MKKLFNLFASAIVILCALTSCGSSKESATEGLGLKIDKSPAQIYAEANRATRAWAKAVDPDEMVARNLADLQARDVMVKFLESSIRTAVANFNERISKLSVNDVSTTVVKDGVSKFADVSELVAQQVLKNVTIAKDDAYRQKNGEVAVYLCVEYMGDVNALADEIVDTAIDKVKNQLTESERQNIEVRRKAVKNELFNILNEQK